MKLFRIVKSKYRFELSGAGVSRSGNRWNSKGLEVIYTAESRALALLELTAHIPIELLKNNFVLLEIEVPENVHTQQLNLNDLPVKWKDFPPSHETQQLGNQFLTNFEKCILKVPSVLVHREFNFLINPKHADFKQIRICEVFEMDLDRRLW